jgi:tetratricopeptide (TPR) repeat protein
MQHPPHIATSLAIALVSVGVASSLQAQVAQAGATRVTAYPATSFRLAGTEAAQQAFFAGFDAYLEADWVRAANEFHRAAADTTLRVARAFELFLTRPAPPPAIADSIMRLQSRNGGGLMIESLTFTQLRERVMANPQWSNILNAMARAVPEDNRLLADLHLRYGVGVANRVIGARMLRDRQPDSYRGHAFVALAISARADSAEAFTAMNEALRLGADKPFAHFAAGELLGRTGRTQEAIAHYTHALRLDSSFYFAAWSRGTAHLWLMHPAEARADFVLAGSRATHPPHRAGHRRAVALTYLYEGDLDRSMREMEQLARALEAEGNVPGQAALAHRALAFMAGAKKDVRAVERHIAAQKKLLNDEEEPGLNLYWDAMSWSMAERPDRAREALNAVDRLIASRDYSLAAGDRNAARAMVLVAERKYDEALALANGTPINAHWARIVAYRVLTAQGRNDEAVQRLRTLFTATPWASDALALPVAYALWGRNLPK